MTLPDDEAREEALRIYGQEPVFKPEPSISAKAMHCEWCSESTEEINNAYTQLDDARAERDRLRKERDALMDDRLEAQRDALLRAIAEHRADPFNGKLLDALHAKAEEIRAGQ